MTEPYAAHPGSRATSPRHGAQEDGRSGWVVFGAGGHARAVVDVLERLGETVVAVVGDAGGRDWHVEVLADDAAGLAHVAAGGFRAAVAIGGVAPRLHILTRLRESALSIENDARSMERTARSIENDARSMGKSARSMEEVAPPIVAASATVARDAVLGAGTVVLEHAHVGPGSRLGAGTIVNTGAIVEHDCAVGEGAHIAPGAVLLGGASVGARTLVGSGARVLPNVTVGSDVTAGAGAVVTRAVADGRLVVGAPAASPTSRAGADR